MYELPEHVQAFGRSKSCIRELAAYGAKRKLEVGAENVFDFSLGNPSIPAPAAINKAIVELASDPTIDIHGYTPANGHPSLRKKIAENLNKRFNLHLDENLVFITAGCAPALIFAMKAICLEDDKVIAVAPFFPEYSVYVTAADADLVKVPANDIFELDVEAIREAITEDTRAILINTPNNPTGVIYPRKNLEDLAKMLKEESEKLGRIIYIITDEPYRELNYTGETCVSPIEVYDNTIMCYSWSKSLSLPGERIGYCAVSDRCTLARDVYTGIQGSARMLGYVNPPSLLQRVMEKCIDECVNPEIYKKNRDLLTAGLKEIGYEFIEPDGAFYLFVKSLEPSAQAFSDKAKSLDLLIVPSNGFGVEGYVRVSYCVSPDMIKRSFLAFKKLYDMYQK